MRRGPGQLGPQAFPAPQELSNYSPAHCRLGELPFSGPAPSQVLSAPSSLCLQFEPCRVTPRNVPTALSALTPDASQQSPGPDSSHRTRTHKLTSHGTVCRPAACALDISTRLSDGIPHSTWPKCAGPPLSPFLPGSPTSEEAPPPPNCHHEDKTGVILDCPFSQPASHPCPESCCSSPSSPPSWAGASPVPASTLTLTILLFTQQPRGPFKCTFYRAPLANTPSGSQAHLG